ncbi:MAG TPA: DUF885 domain-containing protein [Vicinamibacterales bacterium]
MYSAEPLQHFVTHYLAWLHETHPTMATFDGVHAHDDHLDDLSRAAIDESVSRLNDFGRRLAAINPGSLTAEETLDRPWLELSIRARTHELESIRTWERNPHHYADLIAASLASQALFDHAPPTERARRVVSRLKQVPRLLQAARANVREPAGIFVKTALETLNGTIRFIDVDLPRAFRNVDDLHVLSDLADATSEASDALRRYVQHLQEDVLPQARGSFRLGRERFEEKLKLEEGIAMPADRLLAIAERELEATAEEFRRVASRINGGDPLAAWQAVKDDHPAPGELVAEVSGQLAELRAFLEARDLVTIPAGDRLAVGATPDFCRWTFASLWAPGPFETRASLAHYYITDADRAWPEDRQKEHMRDFSRALLWAISTHEAWPGHFLHFLHLRTLASPARKSLMFASTSMVEGWAHYAEQVMIEEGFGRDTPSIRLGQLAEALVRLCRLVVGIRLHTDDLSVEQGVRLFRERAYLEDAAARREAERGTFDPGYVSYALGKLMILKLRDDMKAASRGFTLKTFHDRLLGGGVLPPGFHRQAMLGAGEASSSALIE